MEKSYFVAASSVLTEVRTPSNKSGFEKIMIAALDFLVKQKKTGEISSEKMHERKAVWSNVLVLGATINDWYDLGELNTRKYIRLRRQLRNLVPQRMDDFVRYREELFSLEKHRPKPSEFEVNDSERRKEIIKYREDVNRISLAFAFSVCFDKPIGEYLSEDVGHKPGDFAGFLNSVMAMQVLDDYVGRNGDLRNNRPSFFTAVCNQKTINNERIDPNDGFKKGMNGLFNHYLIEAKRSSPRNLSPILTAVSASRILYPLLVDFVKKNTFAQTLFGFITTERDKNDR
jgi:hypothetical protein